MAGRSILSILKEHLAFLAILAAGVGVSAGAGCGLLDVASFSPRSAAAGDGFASSTAYQQNKAVADTARKASIAAELVANVPSIATPFAQAISNVLAGYGESLSSRLDALEARSATEKITQSDVLMAQAGSLLAGLSALFFKRSPRPTARTPTAG